MVYIVGVNLLKKMDFFLYGIKLVLVVFWVVIVLLDVCLRIGREYLRFVFYFSIIVLFYEGN